MCRTNEGFHFGYGGGHAQQDSSGDNAVADIEFLDFWDSGDGQDIVVIKPVSRVDPQAQAYCKLGGFDDVVQMCPPGFFRGVGVAAGVDFDKIR